MSDKKPIPTDCPKCGHKMNLMYNHRWLDKLVRTHIEPKFLKKVEDKDRNIILRTCDTCEYKDHHEALDEMS